MKPHAFHPEASGEYAEAAAYYARISPALGVRFYDEMERLIGDLYAGIPTGSGCSIRRLAAISRMCFPTP